MTGYVVAAYVIAIGLMAGYAVSLWRRRKSVAGRANDAGGERGTAADADRA